MSHSPSKTTIITDFSQLNLKKHAGMRVRVRGFLKFNKSGLFILHPTDKDMVGIFVDPADNTPDEILNLGVQKRTKESKPLLLEGTIVERDARKYGRISSETLRKRSPIYYWIYNIEVIDKVTKNKRCPKE